MSKKLIFITITVALGGFLFGFDTAVISGTTSQLRSYFGLSDSSLGFTVAIALIGTIIGSIVIYKPTDRYGRKNILIVLAVFYAISALGSAFAKEWYPFLFYRFIGGLAVGGCSIVAPMYIAEISPGQYRGRLVAINQFNIVFGILVAFLSNYLIDLYATNASWRLMFGVEVVPAIAFFGLLFLVPKSPRWLILNNQIDKATEIFNSIFSGSKDSVDDLIASVSKSDSSTNENLFQKKYNKLVMLAVLFAVFNQLSGINAIMYYAPSIFAMAGSSGSAALLQSVLIGLTNMIATIVAMSIIDKYGRKFLMKVGSVGLIVCLITTGIMFMLPKSDTGNTILVVSLVGFIASFAFSQGAVIWVFLSEIFPNSVRAKGQSLGTFVHWIMAAAISWTFPIIIGVTGPAFIFVFYGLMMIVQLIFVMKVMPETKGLELEEIEI